MARDPEVEEEGDGNGGGERDDGDNGEGYGDNGDDAYGGDDGEGVGCEEFSFSNTSARRDTKYPETVGGIEYYVAQTVTILYNK